MAKRARTMPSGLGDAGRYLLAVGVTFAAVGCADTGPADLPPDGVILAQGGDTTGVEELNLALTSLATPCSYDEATRTATVQLAPNEVGVASTRIIDSALLLNGQACGTAKTTTLKKLVVTGHVGGETFILDFMNGDFGQGSATDVGIAINFSAGSGDDFKIRGKSGTDTISFGDLGGSINGDGNLDISLAGHDSVTVTLGDGDDSFTGGGGNGSGSAAFPGDLIVYGGAGADDLVGGDGDDTLSGGPGNDRLAGGAGDDTLNGNEDDDTFDEGTAANGDDTFNGDDGTDIVDYGGRTLAVTVTMDGSGDDGDPLASEADVVTATVEGVNGGAGADTITGSDGDDIIRGGGGDDTIDGRAGDDSIYGDDGDDTFEEGSAANGADVVNGGDGEDTVNYGSRSGDLTIDLDDIATDGESDEGDNLKSDIENVVGGAGDDTITGSAFANVLDGGAGDDVLDGGAGDDTFYEGVGANGSDTFIGGVGIDTVDYAGRSEDLWVTMDGAAADDGEASEGDDVKGDVEQLLCGIGDDVVSGNAQDNYIAGNDGDDDLWGGDGNDLLYGGSGDDDLFGEAGDDTLDGGTGDDNLDCGAGDGDIAMEPGGTDCEL